jgi:hypothetical protein
MAVLTLEMAAVIRLSPSNGIACLFYTKEVQKTDAFAERVRFILFVRTGETELFCTKELN